MAFDLLGGLLVSAPFAIVAWRLRTLTGSGALAGFLCAVAIYLGTYLAGVAVLGAALLLTITASRFRSQHKQALGIDDERGRPRGAANVFANCGVAAAAGLLAALAPAFSGEAGAIATVTAIAAGASDTVASEVGKSLSARPRQFPTFRPAAPGTPGAVSVTGTLAGFAAAVAIAWPAVLLWLVSPEHVMVIAAACLAGSMIESTLATFLERRGRVGSHTLNIVNTACAAIVAGAWVWR